MKAWIISMILFVIILTLIILQSCAVQKLTREMLAIVSSFSQEAGTEEAKIKRLTVMWEERKTLLSLTVSQKILVEVDNALADLQVSSEVGDSYAYQRALLQLQQNIEQLRDVEGFSLKSLI